MISVLHYDNLCRSVECIFANVDRIVLLPKRQVEMSASSAIQLVFAGLKCLITDQMGKKETLAIEPANLNPSSNTT